MTQWRKETPSPSEGSNHHYTNKVSMAHNWTELEALEENVPHLVAHLLGAGTRGHGRQVRALQKGSNHYATRLLSTQDGVMSCSLQP
jgi:hypothetical protein